MFAKSFQEKNHWLDRFKIYLVTSNIKLQLVYLIAFLLPIYINLTFIFIDLWLLFWIAEGEFNRKLSVWLGNKYIILSGCFFLLHLLGLLYTSNKQSGNFNIHLKYTAFIFPFLLVSEGQLNFAKQKIIIKAFIAGCLMNGIVCLSHALWRYYTLGVFQFQYIPLAWFSHPSYLSMYMDFALVLIFYLITYKSPGLLKGEKIFLSSSFFFLLFVILLLQSKTGLIITFLLLCLFFLKYAILKKDRAKAFLLLVFSAFIYFISYTFILNPKESRMMNAAHVLSNGQMDPQSTESTQVRYYVWKAALKVTMKAPFTGVGTGSAEDALLKQYDKDGLSGAATEKLNAHDEYLEYAVSLGIPGLLGLIAYMLVPLIEGIRQHRYVLVLFITIIAFNFLTESVLERLEGTLFYGLFNSLLMFNLAI